MEAEIKNPIAVITPNNFLFRQWKKDIGVQLFSSKVDYIKVSNVDNCKGVNFSKVELGYQYWKVEKEVYHVACSRVIKKQDFNHKKLK